MTKPQKRTGRPPKTPSDQTFKDSSLYNLLVTRLPAPYVRFRPIGNQSVLDTLTIAGAIGVNRYTIYRIMNQGRLSKDTAAGLIRISGGSIDEDDLRPFMTTA